MGIPEHQEVIPSLDNFRTQVQVTLLLRLEPVQVHVHDNPEPSPVRYNCSAYRLQAIQVHAYGMLDPMEVAVAPEFSQLLLGGCAD